MTIAQRRIYLEATLARDTLMRNKVAQSLKEIVTAAQNLPEVVSDEDYKKAKEDKDSNTPKLDTAKTDVLNAITADIAAVPPLNTAQEDAIKKMLDDGMAPETIIRTAKGLVLNNVNIPNYVGLEEIMNKRKLLLGREEAKGRATNAAMLAAINAEILSLQGEIDGIKTATGITDPDINNYSDLLLKYSPEKDAAGTFVSGLTQKIAEGSKLGKDIKTSDDIIKRKETESLKKEGQSQSQRLQKEAELIDRLENVFSDAVVSTLETRYDEMVALEESRRKEQGKEQTTADDQTITQAMKDRWIQYNQATREKIVKPDAINSDVRMLAYEGPDGIKRLMLRDLHLQEPQRDAAGNVVLDAAGHPVMVDIDHRTVNLNNLSDEQKKRLDDVFNKHGEAYKDKLLTDMFLARTLRGKIMDSFRHNKMGLKDHEWQLLEQNFPGKLADKLGKSKEAQAVLKNLEAAGVKPDSKGRWLLYILLGLGLLPVVGGVGALGAAGSALGSAGLSAIRAAA